MTIHPLPPSPRAVALCRVDELADPGSKGFVVAGQQVFAVRQGQQCFVYLTAARTAGSPWNGCPTSFSTAPAG